MSRTLNCSPSSPTGIPGANNQQQRQHNHRVLARSSGNHGKLYLSAVLLPLLNSLDSHAPGLNKAELARSRSQLSLQYSASWFLKRTSRRRQHDRSLGERPTTDLLSILPRIRTSFRPHRYPPPCSIDDNNRHTPNTLLPTTTSTLHNRPLARTEHCVTQQQSTAGIS